MTTAPVIRRWMRVVLLVAMMADPGGASDAEQPTARYYAGLRSRQLFSIAESDCQRRLENQTLTEAERVELTIELSKSFAAHAAYAVGDEQQELWSQSAAILDELLQAHPISRFRSLIATQRAMVPAARGAQLRWQSELFPLDETTRKLAQTTLRDALDRLKPLPNDLQETLRTALTSARPGDESAYTPAPFRVHQLTRDVEFTAAVAKLDLAKVMSAGADRTAVLHEADREFEQLTRIALPDGMAWQSRVHRLDIARQRESANRLARQVSAFVKADPPPAFRDAAVAVLVRSFLDEIRPDEALAALEEHREQYGLESEQLQAMVVETLLAARRLAREKGDAALAADLLKRSEQIDARLSGPWRVLTRMRLAESREADRYGQTLATLVNAANWAWKNGEADEAIENFKRAALQAHQDQQTGPAVELAMTTASIQLESGRFADAADTLGDLLQAYPTAKQSAEADLLRAYALGRIFQEQPSRANKDTYHQSLKLHRAAFPNSPTVDEATWMLARLAEHEQQFDSALEWFSTISPESPRKLPAVVRTAAIYEQLIDELRSQDSPTRDLERKAEQALSQAVESFPPMPSRLDDQQAAVAVSLARLLLRSTPPEFPGADALLARVIDSGQVMERDGGSLDPSWQALVATASQWRVISLTGQGRLADAQTMLERVEARQPQRLLDVLYGLAEIADEIGIEHRRDLGQIQGQLAERLKSQQLPLSVADQRKLDLALAQAQAATGQWRAAASLYEELLWKQPRDREVLQDMATLYEGCGSSSCLRQAMKHWQALESLQQKGTIEWLESRYHMARCSHLLGDHQAARKLIGVTRVLYPELGSRSLKARFEALSRDIQADTQK